MTNFGMQDMWFLFWKMKHNPAPHLQGKPWKSDTNTFPSAQKKKSKENETKQCSFMQWMKSAKKIKYT